jgi:hypothetical protein
LPRGKLLAQTQQCTDVAKIANEGKRNVLPTHEAAMVIPVARRAQTKQRVRKVIHDLSTPDIAVEFENGAEGFSMMA